jgi:virginiamycin B lyase
VSRIALVAAVACALTAVSASSAQAYVYWANGNNIGRANLDGSGVDDAFIAGAGTSSGLAVDGSHVYWGDGGAIARSNLNGGDPQPTLITTDTSPFVAAITTDGNYIYWVTYGTTIYRASLNGAGPTDLVPSAGPGLLSLTYADDTLYYGSGSTIYSVPATGGTPEPFITLTGIGVDTPPPLVAGIATANGVLYWSEVTNSNEGTFGDIGSASISPPMDLDETFVSALDEPGGVATDGTYVYWTDVGTTPNEIGRAAIAAPAGAVDDFVDEPGHLQDGIAVDAGIDPTTTTVTCEPTTLTIGEPSSCIVTVSDSTSSAIPTGTVNFSGNGAAFFSGSPCQLVAKSGVASCTVGADLTAAGTHAVTATYAGDTVHHSSVGTVSLCAGSATQCGGSKPPPAKPNCVVPKLKGKTLAQARTLLAKAHCKLGKVTKPKVKKHHKQPSLVVSSTKPGAGTKLTNGAKVAVKLVAAPKKKHDRR